MKTLYDEIREFAEAHSGELLPEHLTYSLKISLTPMTWGPNFLFGFHLNGVGWNCSPLCLALRDRLLTRLDFNADTQVTFLAALKLEIESLQ